MLDQRFKGENKVPFLEIFLDISLKYDREEPWSCLMRKCVDWMTDIHSSTIAPEGL